MKTEKNKAERPVTFEYLKIPAEILKRRNLSMTEKMLLSDIGYFQGDYRFSNTQIAVKFGVSRRTIIKAIQRLRSDKHRQIVDVGADKYHRRLRLNGEFSALFTSQNGEEAAPLEKGSGEQTAPSSEESSPASEQTAPLNGEQTAPIDNSSKNTLREHKKKGRAKFQKPTLQQIEQHIRKKGYNVHAEKFFYHYESNGWKVGKNPMKSWTATLASWNATEKGTNYANRQTNRPKAGRRDYSHQPAEGAKVLAG